MRPVHPGEILREDYLAPMAMSTRALARQLHVPASRVNDIVRERRAVTADIALRLSRFFGGDARSWLSLQAAYDLKLAEQDESLQAAVQAVHPMWRGPVHAQVRPGS